jgi:ligand-binding SRPBCC domain-containing protein
VSYKASFESRMELTAPVAVVWQRVTTPSGINFELRPWMRMTVPHRMKRRTIADVEPGTRFGRSCLLLFGIIPFEFDNITIAELDQGTRFVERSTMITIKRWQHERTIVPRLDGCEVRDRISFTLRLPFRWVPGIHRLLNRALQRLFLHRHRRLANHFAATMRSAERH